MSKLALSLSLALILPALSFAEPKSACDIAYAQLIKRTHGDPASLAGELLQAVKDSDGKPALSFKKGRNVFGVSINGDVTEFDTSLLKVLPSDEVSKQARRLGREPGIEKVVVMTDRDLGLSTGDWFDRPSAVTQELVIGLDSQGSPKKIQTITHNSGRDFFTGDGIPSEITDGEIVDGKILAKSSGKKSTDSSKAMAAPKREKKLSKEEKVAKKKQKRKLEPEKEAFRPEPLMEVANSSPAGKILAALRNSKLQKGKKASIENYYSDSFIFTDGKKAVDFTIPYLESGNLKKASSRVRNLSEEKDVARVDYFKQQRGYDPMRDMGPASVSQEIALAYDSDGNLVKMIYVNHDSGKDYWTGDSIADQVTEFNFKP